MHRRDKRINVNLDGLHCKRPSKLCCKAITHTSFTNTRVSNTHQRAARLSGQAACVGIRLARPRTPDHAAGRAFAPCSPSSAAAAPGRPSPGVASRRRWSIARSHARDCHLGARPRACPRAGRRRRTPGRAWREHGDGGHSIMMLREAEGRAETRDHADARTVLRSVEKCSPTRRAARAMNRSLGTSQTLP